MSERGFSAEPLAAGVEGVVFRLGGGAVAKVWNSRSRAEVTRLASFYEAVGAAGLGFGTPEIFDIGALSDAVFSVERELPGRPLHADTGASPPPDPKRLSCIVDVLAALAAVRPVDAMRQLPVLGEADPLLGPGSDTFDTALARLVERRVRPAVGQLRSAVADIDELIHAVRVRLAALPPQLDALVHGDLIPANILVDESHHVTAVVDFGFFSTVGSPAFDAAVAANVYDMYGAARDANRAAVSRRIQDVFGFSEALLAIYLAAYALATVNAFGSTTADGHFLWCAEVLSRRDVREALRGS